MNVWSTYSTAELLDMLCSIKSDHSRESIERVIESRSS